MAFRFAPILGILIAASAAQAASDGRYVPGAELDGTWEGILSNGGMGLPMIVVITTEAGKGTGAVLDIGDPAPKDIPVASFTREKDSVRMNVPAVGGKFEGLVSADLAAIAGKWTQADSAGAPVPLILRKKLQ